MAAKSLPCPTVLRQFLRYEPETGHLFWRHVPHALFPSAAHSSERRSKAWNGKYAGKRALTYSEPSRPYPYGDILGSKCYAHRAIWALVHGYWPLMVDHINGDKADNRLKNLREVNRSGNMMNRKIGSHNSCGVMGVYFDKNRGLWAAEIMKDGRKVHLGRFISLEKAAAARREAQETLGFGPRHGCA